jgi:galactose-1-phosphate uridylyltransferase
MADGTVKQVNPFTGVEVWSVPDRGNKPWSVPLESRDGSPLDMHCPEDYCAFCESRLFETAPEKARVVLRDNRYEVLHRISPSDYLSEKPVFRRVANLFEIVSVDYWAKNYGYKLSSRNSKWKESYFSSHEGYEHVMRLLRYKLKQSGRENEFDVLSDLTKYQLADAFFGGGHELIIANRHYLQNATQNTDYYSSGDMSDEEHFRYYMFIIDSMADIIENNRYVRYISVFKNWLRSAGASFEHLHTQLVSIDEWGQRIEKQIKMIMEDRNVFNTYGPNFAGYHNLIFAENDAALALIGTGHRFPTIDIYSKSVNSRPHEHSPDEVRGISDLVRACHAAIGRYTSINEEWYYTPFDSIFKMPWHINIKLRITTPAGFEGGTSIYINPLPPVSFRDQIVPRLYELRYNGFISPGIRIAEECRIAPNPLLYYKST